MSDIKNPQIDSKTLAGEEVKKGADEVLRFGKRIARYGVAKQRSQAMASFIKESVTLENAPPGTRLGSLFHSINQCGSYLLFHNYYTVNKIRLARSNFCHYHLLCPFCAIRRASKQILAHSQKYNLITKENPGLSAYLLTITVKNGSDLVERMEHLRSGIRSMMTARRRQKNRFSSGGQEFNKVEAGVYSFEVTNKGNGWHPHVHMVVLVDKENPIDGFELGRQWLKRTGDSFIVDVRPLFDDSISGFIEVFKYALKFSGLDLDKNWEAYRALKGKTLTGSFGLFRGLKIDTELSDKELFDLPYVEILLKYIEGKYKLIESENR